MRSTLLPLAACLLVVLVALLLFVDGDPPQRSVPAERDAPKREALAPPTIGAAAPDAPVPQPQPPADERTAIEAEDDAAAEPEFPMAQVFGRAVDTDGRPVSGFELQLFTSDGLWREGVDVPLLETGRWKVGGWRRETDESGRYSFEVPVPSSDWVSLFGESDPHLGKTGRSFGPAGGRNEPRIVAGENEVGDLVVTPAGALQGTVYDVSDVPIEGAIVRLEGDFPGGYGVSAETDDAGRYLIGHLPAGAVTLSGNARGYQSADTDRTFDVEEGRTLRGPDFRLERAAVLAGIVIEPGGTPLPDVHIQGWPVGSGRGAAARSGEDGRFEMFLPQDEPYSLRVERDPRFRPWGGRSPATTFEPGTRDIRIELERAPRMTIRVLDADTERPILRYSIFAGDVGGYRLQDLLRAVDSEDGTTVVSATPGEGGRVWVRAPQHVPVRRDLAFDDLSGEDRVQTIRLVPGASVEGRALLDGRPAGAVGVTVEPQRLPKEEGGEVDPDDFWGDSWRLDVDEAAAHARFVSTDADGRFVVDDLAEGTYRVALESERNAPWSREGLVVEARSETDLGEIALQPDSVLRCRVVLPAGVSPVGLEYEVGLEPGFEAEITRRDGMFELTGLGPGEHVVRIRAEGRRLMEDVLRTFRVDAGATREVVIDLTGMEPGSALVRVRENAELESYEVLAVQVDRSGIPLRDAHPRPLVPTGEPGEFSGSVAVGRHVAFARAGRLRLGRGDPFEVEAGTRTETDLALEVGRLTLRFPEELTIPEGGVFQLRLLAEGETWGIPFQWTHLRGEGPRSATSLSHIVWRGHRVEIGRLATGAYEATVASFAAADTPRILVPETTHSIEIRAGEEYVLDVPAK